MQPKLLWMDGDSSASDLEVGEAVHGLEVVHESSLSEGLRRLNTGEYSLVIMNVSSFGSKSENALDEVLHHDRRFPVIVHAPEGSIDDAIRFTRHGAFYVLLGKIELSRLDQAVKTAVERCGLRAHPDLDAQPWRGLVIGQSRAMQHTFDVIRLIASKRVTVLISGETGTGKEVIAKAVHAASKRSTRPMVSINCTALPASLIETELFGHAKGAFTGAHGSRIGRFEQAHRSTIFLDEIGDLPLDAQAKLLRVLQEQEFERVGSSETVRVDVRVLAASNIDLEQAVKDRRFREDLYYRLNVVPIRIPPLRERREDIPLLVEHFLQKIQAAEDAPAKRISPEAVELLMALDWPGNVRQLEHAIHKAVALSGDRRLLVPGDFTERRHLESSAKPQPSAPAISMPSDGIDFDEVVGSFELSLLNQALLASGGNKARAADLLRIKRTTLLAKIKAHERRGVESPGSGTNLAPPRPTALIFERDGSVRKLIAKTLEQEGYRILEAASGPAAIELFQCWDTHINLLVTEIASADKSSGDASARLRSLAVDLPAILVCHHPRLRDFECNGPKTQLLQRPFAPDELLSAVKAIASESVPPFAVCA